MSRDRAAYMREYRAKKARPMTDHEMAMALTSKPGWTLVADEHLALLQREVADLQAEVARLKRELAARPTDLAPHLRSFAEIGREAQARRDEILRRINKAK